MRVPLGAVLLGWVVACVPNTAGYLTIPLETEDGLGRSEAAVVLALRDLAANMHEFDANQVVFYTRGRQPIPHRLVDTDGDGELDSALVVVPVASDGSSRLVALSPGPRADGAPPAADRQPDPGIVLRWDLSQN